MVDREQLIEALLDCRVMTIRGKPVGKLWRVEIQLEPLVFTADRIDTRSIPMLADTRIRQCLPELRAMSVAGPMDRGRVGVFARLAARLKQWFRS